MKPLNKALAIISATFLITACTAANSDTLSLSADQKSITVNDQTLLEIDHDTIFTWFQTESQLCGEVNINTEARDSFCKNKETFRGQTRFASIVVSPDNMKIGFTIESDAMTPDTVVGIFLRSTNKVELLTNYYLQNKFVSFSPNGKYFVYEGICWEGMCGIFIKDSETLAEKLSINNPEYIDMRTENAEFIRWISDNEVEYKIGTEIKQEKF